jgi:hypothetical protein
MKEPAMLEDPATKRKHWKYLRNVTGLQQAKQPVLKMQMRPVLPRQGGLPQRRGDFLQQMSSSNLQSLQRKIIWECGQLQLSKKWSHRCGR